MSIRVSKEIRGFNELQRNLKTVVGKIERKANRSAINKAATPIVREAKRNVTIDTGLLKKSIGKKVRTYKAKKQVIAVVGPRKGFRETDENGNARDPAKYSHLVELGTSHSQAKPFLRPAMDSKEDESRRIYKEELKKDVSKEVKKFNKRNPI